MSHSKDNPQDEDARTVSGAADRVDAEQGAEPQPGVPSCSPSRPFGLDPNCKARTPLRIALIESRPMIRGALVHPLKAIRRECHIDVFASPVDFLAAGAPNADLIVFSFCAAEARNGAILNIIGELCRAFPLPVVLITDADDPDFVASAIRHGIRGYIPTTLDLRVAIAAIGVVLAGGTFAPTSSLIQARLSSHGDGSAGLALRSQSEDTSGPRPEIGEPVTSAELTAREAEVLDCVAKGQPNKIIARQLDMCEGTVKVHLRNLMRKLQAANRTQLAVRARWAIIPRQS
jgi:DNA-binding NarL/FixJ family response regulator